jgi:hypothetical protein
MTFIKTQGQLENFENLNNDKKEEMIRMYFDHYRDMTIKSAARTATHQGVTVDANFEDYYIYAQEAKAALIKEKDPNLNHLLEGDVRLIFGVPATQSMDAFFEQLDVMYSHIEGMQNRFITHTTTSQNQSPDPDPNPNALNLINIVKGVNQ